MVKGIAKKVVVVQPQGNDLFEQAIFIVRDEQVSGEDILKEACFVANEYAKKQVSSGRWKGRLSYIIAMFLGAAAVGGFWFLSGVL